MLARNSLGTNSAKVGLVRPLMGGNRREGSLSEGTSEPRGDDIPTRNQVQVRADFASRDI